MHTRHIATPLRFPFANRFNFGLAILLQSNFSQTDPAPREPA